MPSYRQIDDLFERHEKLFKERLSEGLFVVYGQIQEGWRVYSVGADRYYPHGTVQELPEGAVPITQAAPRPQVQGEAASFNDLVSEVLTTREAKERVRKLGGETKPPKGCQFFEEGWCRIDGKPCPFSEDTYRECPKLKDATRHPEDQIVLVF